MPVPPSTTNRPYFIGSEETGNMNPTNTSPLSKNSYQKTDRPFIAQANGSTAATEVFSVPVETKKSFDTNRSKYVAPVAMPDQQNVLGRRHFYNETDAGRNPENLVEQQGNYATTQPALNGYYAYPGEYQNYQNHNQHQPFFRNNHRSVKLPDIRVNKFDGDPRKWNEWSSMFSSVIHNNRDISDIERMSYLQSLVIGSAKEAVSGYLCNPGFYHEALSELERRFGNPQHVVSALTKELELWQRPQASDHATLISYASFLRKLVQTFNAHGFYADLKSTYLVRIARDKLPWSLKMKWSEHLVDINSTFPGIEDLSNWMDRQARACEQLQESVSLQNQPNDNGKQTNFNRRDKNNHHNGNSNHQSKFFNQNINKNKRYGNRNSNTNGSFRNGSEPVNNYSHNNVRRDNIGGTSQFMNNSGSTTSNNNRISERNSSNTQQTKSKKCPVDQGDH